jgi:uncharacterized protein (DUF362 family)
MNNVAVTQIDARYPTTLPYSPTEGYPEYPFEKNFSQSNEENRVYLGIRDLLKNLNLDRENFGKNNWNPLGNLVRPGMTVVIKPNFVLSRHKEEKDLFSIITHPSVIRTIIDYVWIALMGKGTIIVADAPQYDCNWQELLDSTGIDKVIQFYAAFDGPQVKLFDLRRYWSQWKHFPSLLEPLSGDPKGNLIVNLGEKSALYGKPHPEKLYGAVYQRNETIQHHTDGIHEYEFGRTIMDADVVISVPKLKVHKKVGVTLNVKGLVGTNTNKNYLVHYSVTSPNEGGDQYPEGLFTPVEKFLINRERWMYDHLLAPKKKSLEYVHRSIYWLHNHTTRKFGLKVDEKKRQLDAGNWYGNDSAWRMAVDLYRAFLFSDEIGIIKPQLQRKTFSIIDGVIGGENNGPLTPDPKPVGLLIGGEDLLSVDIVASRLMGFDPLKIKMYEYLLDDPYFIYSIKNINEITIISDDQAIVNCLSDKKNEFFKFQPHPGWLNHLEI